MFCVHGTKREPGKDSALVGVALQLVALFVHQLGPAAAERSDVEIRNNMKLPAAARPQTAT
jgi:hypothetical protein